MSRAMLYAVNTATQTLAPGATVAFGQPVRRYGCGVAIEGGTVVLSGPGYYELTANINATSTAGDLTLTLYKDGVAIPGATATITAAATTNYQVVLPAVVRNVCCASSTITCVVTGETATVTNAAIVVEKQ